MIPCVVSDLPTFGAFALAAILIATVYLIYRDIRMIMQMVNDLREEFMVLHLTCKQAGGGCPVVDDDGDVEDDDDELDGDEMEYGEEEDNDYGERADHDHCGHNPVLSAPENVVPVAQTQDDTVLRLSDQEIDGGEPE
jgi:hypothetical protein